MQAFLGIVMVLTLIIGVFSFLIASTVFGQLGALIMFAVSLLCAVGIAVLVAIERQGVEMRDLINRARPPE